ncbi:MAG: hypothetical protein M3N50_11405 [Pseudomonadota bacterium]|nr:hypothetical protein [Pseudomonadota bacterium]
MTAAPTIYFTPLLRVQMILAVEKFTPHCMLAPSVGLLQPLAIPWVIKSVAGRLPSSPHTCPSKKHASNRLLDRRRRPQHINDVAFRLLACWQDSTSGIPDANPAVIADANAHPVPRWIDGTRADVILRTTLFPETNRSTGSSSPE